MQIPARALSSDISVSEEWNVYASLSLKEPTIKLLYVTPEKVGLSFPMHALYMYLYTYMYKLCIVYMYVVESKLYSD